MVEFRLVLCGMAVRSGLVLSRLVEYGSGVSRLGSLGSTAEFGLVALSSVQSGWVMLCHGSRGTASRDAFVPACLGTSRQSWEGESCKSSHGSHGWRCPVWWVLAVWVSQVWFRSV